MGGRNLFVSPSPVQRSLAIYLCCFSLELLWGVAAGFKQKAEWLVLTQGAMLFRIQWPFFPFKKKSCLFMYPLRYATCPPLFDLWSPRAYPLCILLQSHFSVIAPQCACPTQVNFGVTLWMKPISQNVFLANPCTFFKSLSWFSLPREIHWLIQHVPRAPHSPSNPLQFSPQCLWTSLTRYIGLLRLP